MYRILYGKDVAEGADGRPEQTGLQADVAVTPGRAGNSSGRTDGPSDAPEVGPRAGFPAQGFAAVSGPTVHGIRADGNGQSGLLPALCPIHITASSGRTVQVMGDRVTYKAVAEETGGAYSLFECGVEPGHWMRPHYRRYEDTTFWGLEGELDFRLGDERVYLGPGDYAFVPRGTAHALANVGGVPGRFLLLVTPGGLHEKYLEEMGGARGVPEAPTSPAEVERVGMIAAKYGIEFLPAEGRLAGWDR